MLDKQVPPPPVFVLLWGNDKDECHNFMSFLQKPKHLILAVGLSGNSLIEVWSQVCLSPHNCKSLNMNV